jgi:hypothetical protein
MFRLFGVILAIMFRLFGVILAIMSPTGVHMISKIS